MKRDLPLPVFLLGVGLMLAGAVGLLCGAVLATLWVMAALGSSGTWELFGPLTLVVLGGGAGLYVCGRKLAAGAAWARVAAILVGLASGAASLHAGGYALATVGFLAAGYLLTPQVGRAFRDA